MAEGKLGGKKGLGVKINMGAINCQPQLEGRTGKLKAQRAASKGGKCSLDQKAGRGEVWTSNGGECGADDQKVHGEREKKQREGGGERAVWGSSWCSNHNSSKNRFTDQFRKPGKEKRRGRGTHAGYRKSVSKA